MFLPIPQITRQGRRSVANSAVDILTLEADSFQCLLAPTPLTTSQIWREMPVQTEFPELARSRKRRSERLSEGRAIFIPPCDNQVREQQSVQKTEWEGENENWLFSPGSNHVKVPVPSWAGLSSPLHFLLSAFQVTRADRVENKGFPRWSWPLNFGPKRTHNLSAACHGSVAHQRLSANVYITYHHI